MADKEGSTSINIYARLRKIMPWEDPGLSATAIDDRKILNRTSKRQQAYEFTQVFRPADDNTKCFKHICIPLLEEVQRGYNALLMAYGQTGSGKTYSVLGKTNDHKSVKGLLTLSLEYLLKQKNISHIELSAVETFGHHIQKIRLFDLADDINAIEEWDKKVPMKSSAKIKNANKIRLTQHNITETVNRLHQSSHFAPTGKNPESSRGHICYVTTVHMKYFMDDDENITETVSLNTANAADCTDLISHWVVVDLAGSEGQSAINTEFQKKVTPSDVLARRLEAWCINHGLSELQVIFNELRGLKKKGSSVGTGLKKTLSEFISNRSFIAVLFTISPSQDNSQSTQATLRFAESAALVKCSPIKTEKKVNKAVLIDELNKFIQRQKRIIEERNMRIIELEEQVVGTYLLDDEQQVSTDVDDDITPQSVNIMKGANVKPMLHDDVDDLELPSKVQQQLTEFAELIDEEKHAEDIWCADKSQFISNEDEEDLEQSMKDQMSESRRASRVSSDVQFVSNLLSLSDHADIGFNEDMFTTFDHKMDPLVESDLEDEEHDADGGGGSCRSYKVQKIMSDYKNGYQLIPSSLSHLSRNELMYLCTVFAKYNHEFHQNETDKIIESHEEQIQFLTKELNRLQRYHQHKQHPSLSLQSDFHLNMMLDDIDEKFEQSVQKDKRDTPSPSSTRIDPIAAYNNQYEHAPLVKQQIEHRIVVMNEDNVVEDEHSKGEEDRGCADRCVVL